jgi:hypothetical protein
VNLIAIISRAFRLQWQRLLDALEPPVEAAATGTTSGLTVTEPETAAGSDSLDLDGQPVTSKPIHKGPGSGGAPGTYIGI